MKKLLLAALLAAVALPAAAQNAVTQFGTVTVNRPAKWIQSRQVGDAGGLTGDNAGRGFAPFSITDLLGCGLQFNTALTTGSYSYFCFGHNASAAPILNINGTEYPLLGAGNGNMIGPISPFPTADDIVLWNGSTNTKDGGALTGKIGGIAFAGSTSGTTTVLPQPVASGTITLPASTINLVDFSQGVSTVPYAVTPVYARLLASKTYDASFNSNFNAFQIASVVNNQSSANAVAMFGQGESTLSGSTAWGGNHVGAASVAGATGIGDEINCLRMHTGATAYCLVIASAGNFAPTTAISIQANASTSTFQTGILFNSDTENAVSGALIQSGANTVAQLGINLSGVFSVGELAVPSFGVAATPGSINSKLLVTGSASGNPSISVAATGAVPATNGNMILNPLGTGAVQVNGPVSILGGSNLTMSGGGKINLIPAVAPAAPASGWYLYVDSGDGNKLKTVASTGTIVTLGTQ